MSIDNKPPFDSKITQSYFDVKAAGDKNVKKQDPALRDVKMWTVVKSLGKNIEKFKKLTPLEQQTLLQSLKGRMEKRTGREAGMNFIRRFFHMLNNSWMRGLGFKTNAELASDVYQKLTAEVMVPANITDKDERNTFFEALFNSVPWETDVYTEGSFQKLFSDKEWLGSNIAKDIEMQKEVLEQTRDLDLPGSIKQEIVLGLINNEEVNQEIIKNPGGLIFYISIPYKLQLDCVDDKDDFETNVIKTFLDNNKTVDGGLYKFLNENIQALSHQVTSGDDNEKREEISKNDVAKFTKLFIQNLSKDQLKELLLEGANFEGSQFDDFKNLVFENIGDNRENFIQADLELYREFAFDNEKDKKEAFNTIVGAHYLMNTSDTDKVLFIKTLTNEDIIPFFNEIEEALTEDSLIQIMKNLPPEAKDIVYRHAKDMYVKFLRKDISTANETEIAFAKVRKLFLLMLTNTTAKSIGLYEELKEKFSKPAFAEFVNRKKS